MKKSEAEQVEGTVGAARAVLGGKEGNGRVEDFVNDLGEKEHEVVGVGSHIVDIFLSELQDRAVVVGSGVLDEKQGGRDGEFRV